MSAADNIFQLALMGKNHGRPPVWFMRQAGRYHSHYQKLRAKYSFIELCKLPDVAAEVAMGPMDDFDFDAAILFSDLLFPLESLGMGLRYDPSPKLDWYLRDTKDLSRLKSGNIGDLHFQAEAIAKTRAQLSTSKGLLGFVGGPFTLYCYAVEGSHQGDFSSATAGFKDGRFLSFMEKLVPLLVDNMILQANAGVDTVAVLDTCAGEIPFETYQENVFPILKTVFELYSSKIKNIPISYYSKKTDSRYWNLVSNEKNRLKYNLACLGVDWNYPIATILSEYGSRIGIQGNFNPELLFLPVSDLESKLRTFFESTLSLKPDLLNSWVCGLGHGVIQKTPEASVRLFLQLQKEYFNNRNSKRAAQ